METANLFENKPQEMVPGCTLQEYRRNYASQPLYKAIRTYAIIGYVLCAVNMVLALLSNAFLLVEMAVLLALILGVHLGKKKWCAVALAVYSVVNCIIVLINTGRFGGWMWIVVAAGFLDCFRKIDREYKSEMAPKGELKSDLNQSFLE